MYAADKDTSPRGSRRSRSRFRLRHAGPARDPLDTVSLSGDCVRDASGAEIGRIEGVMLDGSRERIAYAILSLRTGAARLYAVPWSVLRVGPAADCVVLDVPKEQLRAAPAFERDRWPSITDSAWRETIDSYYCTRHRRRSC